MINILSTIVEKLKIKELVGVLFICVIIITFIPDRFSKQIGIDEFINKYQMYISLVMIILAAYYIYQFITWIFGSVSLYKHNAIKYLKKNISTDEIELLIETYYYDDDKQFHSCGRINMQDGRRIPLIQMGIIYQSSNLSTHGLNFDYNLQPAILKFLNNSLKKGAITINNDTYNWYGKG